MSPRALRSALAAAIPLTTMLSGAAPAGAYTFIGHWPSHTVRYYDATPYRTEVRAAATAWNRSGVRIRWVAVPKGRASVIIRISRRIPTAGLAYANTAGRGWIKLQPNLAQPSLGPIARRTLAEQIIAHEMGHIIGLGHETHRCAVMAPNLDSRGPPRCKLAKEIWRRRCRLLERDDIAGAVRLHGGHVKVAPGSPFCPVASPPAAPTDVHLTEPPEGEEDPAVKISWRNPASPRDGTVLIVRRSGTCPRGPDDPKAVKVATGFIGGSRNQSERDQAPGLTPGRWCYLLVVQTGLGQPGKAATAFLEYRGRAPVARFTSAPSDTDPNLILLEDASSDPDGQVVAWSWAFGDGATATGRAVDHRYPGPGTYTVTLTVTDNSGRTATTTDQVTVEPPVEE